MKAVPDNKGKLHLSVQPIERCARLCHQELAVLVDDAHRLVPEARRGGAVPPENVGFLEFFCKILNKGYFLLAKK